MWRLRDVLLQEDERLYDSAGGSHADIVIVPMAVLNIDVRIALETDSTNSEGKSWVSRGGSSSVRGMTVIGFVAVEISTLSRP